MQLCARAPTAHAKRLLDAADNQLDLVNNATAPHLAYLGPVQHDQGCSSELAAGYN